MLSRAGFQNVYSLGGGIDAWEAPVATGEPEPTVRWLSGQTSVAQFIALAWLMEQGTRSFYERLAGTMDEEGVAELFGEFSRAEQHHQQTLGELYEALTMEEVSVDFPRRVLEAQPDEELMEGGMKLAEALAWVEGRRADEVLSLAIGLEANAYDRFLCLERRVSDQDLSRVIEVLAWEEKRHLQRLSEALERLQAAKD